MDELDYKKLFASHLLSDVTNPFKAAQAVFGDDLGNACKYALLWAKDPEVLEELERLKKTAKLEDQIASKVEALQLAWTLANNDWMKGIERAKFLELFLTGANYMPDKTVNKNINADVKLNKVMMVKDHGEDQDWEKKITEQQQRLLNAE